MNIFYARATRFVFSLVATMVVFGGMYIPVFAATPAVSFNTLDTPVQGENSNLGAWGTTVLAQSFVTGSTGGQLDKIVIQDAYVNPNLTNHDVKLYDMGAEGTIGSPVVSFGTSPDNDSGRLTFTPTSTYTLQPNTLYWVVVKSTPGITWKYGTNTNTGDGTLYGSMIRAKSTDDGATFLYDGSVDAGGSYGTGAWTFNMKVTYIPTVNFDGGDGSSGTPYQISKCEQLPLIEDHLSSYFTLLNDIDCNTAGNDAMIHGTFSGNFNGNGHSITVDINETATNVGIFADVNGGTITGLVSKGSIRSSGANVGGIVGSLFDGTITKSANFAEVYGHDTVGGIAAVVAGSSSIDNTYNAGHVATSSGYYIGGIAGVFYGSSSINHSYNRGVLGNLEDVRYHVGGLIGQRASGTATVSNSFNVGQVLTNQSTFFFGGLWGNDALSGGGVLSSGWTNNYFDSVRSTRTMCGYANDGSMITSTVGACTQINGGSDDYDYFKNTTSHAPLNTWDFTDIWETNTKGYPTFKFVSGDEGPVADGPADTTAPQLVSISPANGAIDVSKTANIVLIFDEPVYVDAGYITLAANGNMAVVENISITSDRISGNGTTTITIDPVLDFVEGEIIYVNISSSALRDDSNNYFPGFTGGDAKVFAVADHTAPILTQVTGLSGKLSKDSDMVYRYTTNEACDVQATPPTSTTGAVEIVAEEVVVGEPIGITLQGTKAGGTYSFTFSCRDAAHNVSNTLTVGPFTVFKNSSASAGGYATVSSLAKQGIALEHPAPQSLEHKTCPADQILTQNLKAPSQNGKYNSYTGGIVKEAKILQAHLNRLGFNAGPIDGFLGPLSDGAIKRMQTFLGTKPDGFVGPKTRAVINTSCK